jgi:hypothetical protein
MSKSKYYREERRDYIWSTHQSCNRKDPGFSRGNLFAFFATAELISKLYGIVVAMAAPLTFEGDIDEDALRSLTRYLVDAGVNGIFVMSTTGKFSYIVAANRNKCLKSLILSFCNF